MSDNKIMHFNIRVYGIAINEENRILLTDEYRLGRRMTKFPGGGLEFGEGTLDCLKRECMEEFAQEIDILKHFYTTDYFQPTQLIEEPQQLISIYYMIKLKNPDILVTTTRKFDFEDKDGAQTFRWVNLKDLREDELTFPIDRKVMGMVKEDRELKI